MAVANTKSNIVTNADYTPRKESPLWYSGARLYESVSTVEVAAADDNNSVYRMFRVRSNWRVSQLEVACDAITSGTAFDIGLWDTVDNGALVVASCQQLWASAVDLSSALPFTDKTYEATATNIALVEKQIWELAGLTVDPNKEYDIALIGTTVGSAAGTISMRMRYCKGQ